MKQLRFTIDESDVLEGQARSVLLYRAAQRGDWWIFGINVVVWMLIGIALMTAFRTLQRDTHWVGSPVLVVLVCLAAAAVGHVVMLSLCARRAQAAQRAAYAPYPVEQSMLVSDQGLTFESRWGSALYFWSALQSVNDLPSHIALTVRPLAVIVIPKRSFESSEHREEFLALVRSKVEG